MLTGLSRTLTAAQLNRATLARQCLLGRVPGMAPLDLVRHLGGLQAQTPHTWYIGFWSRLEGFEPGDVARAVEDRRLVRMALHRSTIHLVTAEDALWLRPLLAPVLLKPLSSFNRFLDGLDQGAVTEAARALVEAEPRTWSALGRALAERWPDRDPAALAQVARARLALVQVPPRGVWGRSGPAAHTTLEAWLGRAPVTDPVPEDLVRRYLAAFGPASVKDAQAWSGSTRLGAVFERLRDELVSFRAEDGRELFDLPDAPRPDAPAPAPVRFLYEFDNLLLGHADRSRFLPSDLLADAFKRRQVVPGAVLVDGVVAAAWDIARRGRRATLTVRPARRLTTAEREEVAAEGERLLAFYAPGADARTILASPARTTATRA